MEARDVEMLLGSCIHDMKNSISMILNSADHLSEIDSQPEEAIEYLQNGSELGGGVFTICLP